MVTTVPPVTSKSTLSLADAVEERTKAVRQHISAENTRLGQLLQKQNLFLFCIFPLARGKSLQKCGIKGPRQQFRSALALDLAFQVCKNHRHISTEFPNDLAAGPARRRQRICIGYNRDRFKSTLAF
jgi:hypothetical protein